MKRLVKSLFLAGVLMALLCVTAMAADVGKKGIYEVTQDVSGVSIVPNGKMENNVPVGNGATANNFYVDADYLTVTLTPSSPSAQYLVLALNDNTGKPVEANIQYIDQAAGNAISFKVYPKQLESGKTYYIYITSDQDSNYTGLTPVGTFKYYMPYKLGDVDNDGQVKVGDALSVLQMAVGRGKWSDFQKFVANVDGSEDGVKVGDALLVLQAAVGKIKL